ncbi:MAG: DUF3325 family protein [Halopseudomonas sabulinigri]
MSVSLFVAVFVVPYSGMLACCLGMERHWKKRASRLPTSWRRYCRPLGVLLLALAAYLAMQLWPLAMAWVAWLGLISLSGLGLLFLLPYAPRLALSLPVLAVVLLVIGAIWV